MSEASLLNIVNNVAVEIKFPTTTQVIGNTDKNVVTIYNAVRKAIERDVFRVHNWASLRRLFEVTFDGVNTYFQLPVDFDSLKNQTAWDNTNQRPALGAASQYEWEMVTRSQLTIPNQQLYFMEVVHNFGSGYYKALQFFPLRSDAGAGPHFTSGYITNWYIIDGSTRLPKTAFDSDDDLSLLDSDLVEQAATVRMLKGLGMGFQAEEVELQAMVSERRGKDGGMMPMDMAGSRRLVPAYPNTPGFVPSGVRYGGGW